MQGLMLIALVVVLIGLGIATLSLTNINTSSSTTSTPSTTTVVSYQTSSITSTSTISSSYKNQSQSGLQQTVAYAGDGTNVNAGNLPACSGSAYLTRSPINNSQLYWIEPLGHVGGPHVLPSQGDHIYFYAQVRTNNTPYPTPVYSPGNVTLLQVAVTKANNSRELSTSYVLFFSPCKNLMFGFQLANVSSLVQNALSGLTPLNCQSGSLQSLCVYNTLLRLKAGDRIGMIGSASFDYGLDFAAADVRTQPLSYIDLKEATGFLADSYLHTVCPLDYFVNSTKAYLYSRIVQKNTSTNAIPACGTTMQDLTGTAQGNWYKKSSINSQGQYRGLNISASLAIMHLDVNPSFGIISAGGSTLIPNSNGGVQMAFASQSSGQINREPSQVAPDGKVYCYQGAFGYGTTYLNGTVNLNNGQLGHLDIRLDNATALEIDYASGQCAPVPILTNPTVYLR